MLKAKVLKAMLKCCSKQKNRPAIDHVWLEDGIACATDTYVAVIANEGTMNTGSMVLDPDLLKVYGAGEEVPVLESNGKPLAWKESEIKKPDLMAVFRRFVNEEPTNEVCLDPELLSNVLGVFKAAGLRPKVESTVRGAFLSASGEGGCIEAIVMGVRY